MVKIDLITGFLGSGKTTFLKKYARYWMEQGKNIGILENDFGAVNVDMMLLQDLMGDNCDLEMVAGGCDEDCHRRRFKTKLISMGMCGYDRVLVEPSGIYDVDEFFDVLHEEPLDRWYEIDNVFAIVDAKLDTDLSETSGYLLASEIANAGRIILSRTQEATGTEIEGIKAYMQEVLHKAGCKRDITDAISTKEWDSLTEEDMEAFAQSGYKMSNYVKMDLDQKEAFTSLYYMNVRMNREQLEETTKALFADKECGKIFRIKGFMRLEDESWIEWNATRQVSHARALAQGQEVLIVIGEGLQEEVIGKYLRPYIWKIME